AKGRHGMERAMLVYPGGAAFEAGGEPRRFLHVVAPDGAAQTDFQRVGTRERFLDGFVFHDRDDRPELLLLHHSHLIRGVGDHREGVKVSGAGALFAAEHDAGTLRASVIDIVDDLLELHPVGHRADQVVRVQTVTNGDAGAVVRKLAYHLLVLVLVHVQPLQGRAGLPRVDETAPEQLLQQGLDVGSREDDTRIVATQLECHALERLGRAAHDLLSGGDRAREHDLVDTGMRGQVRAYIGTAGDGVYHPRRQDLVHQLHEPPCRQRRERGGLYHNRAAYADRGHHVPHGNEQ